MMNIKKIAAVALTACTVFAMTCLPALAADYTYNVTVSGGNYGTVSADATVNKGETFSITADAVTVTDAKYYVKGFAVAGQADTFAPEFSTEVTEDIELVTVYGIENSKTVEYTVRFVDYDNPDTELAPSQTFKGQIGDMPKVSKIAIDGFTPLANNAIKTLVADPAANVFTFTYANNTVYRIVDESGVIINEVTEYVTTGGTTANNGANGGNNEAVTEEGNGENEEGAEEAVAEEGAAENEQPTLEQQETVNLDEEEAPLANGDVTPAGMPAGTKAGIAIGIIAIIAIIVAVATRRKKNA